MNDGVNGENVAPGGKNVAVELTKTEKKILEFLMNSEGMSMNSEGMSTRSLAASIGADRKTIQRGTKRLIDKDLIERVGSDQTGVWKVKNTK